MFSYSRIKNVLYTKLNKKAWFGEVLSYTIMRYNSIESRMIETFRYVDCNPLNHDVFSYEYASILRDVGSVFGSIMDRLVRKTGFLPANEDSNMGHYRKWLTKEIQNIHLVSVGLSYPIQHRFLSPFQLIKHENQNLRWWAAYNNVKHSDISMFKDGNLRNALNSLGALAILYAIMDVNKGSGIRLFSEIGFVTPQPTFADVYGKKSLG